MNPPKKPWENSSINYRNSSNITELQNDGPVTRGGSYAPSDVNSNPPPVPSRPNQFSSNYQSPFSTGYGGMFGSPYSSYLYGSPGYGFSSYGGMYPNSSFNNSFMSGVENYTQPTFESFQSLIQAFSSVSMMLESTLFAVQNSVRAVLNVADQFSRLRIQLASSWVAIVHSIKYYFRRLLILFRVKKALSSETVWEELTNGGSNTETRHWPIVLFFAIVLGTPWVLWKLLRSISLNKNVSNEWQKGIGAHFLAETKYPYTAVNSDELTISPDEIIRIAPKHSQPHIRGWLLASNGNTTGLVPANYIKILGKNREALAESRGDTLPKIEEIETNIEDIDLDEKS